MTIAPTGHTGSEKSWKHGISKIKFGYSGTKSIKVKDTASSEEFRMPVATSLLCKTPILNTIRMKYQSCLNRLYNIRRMWFTEAVSSKPNVRQAWRFRIISQIDF